MLLLTAEPSSFWTWIILAAVFVLFMPVIRK